MAILFDDQVAWDGGVLHLRAVARRYQRRMLREVEQEARRLYWERVA